MGAPGEGSAGPRVVLARVARAAECQPGGTDILAAVSGGHGGVPLAGERGQQRRGVAARGADREVNVLQRPFEREFGREVTLIHLAELGVGDRGVQRAALDHFGELLVTDAQAVSKAAMERSVTPCYIAGRRVLRDA